MMMKKSPSTPEALGRRLNRVRLVQCILLIINLIMAAYLAGYIGNRRLGLRGGLPVAVIVAGFSLTLTILSSWLGRNFDGYDKRRCVSIFLLFDLTCACCQIGAIAILADSGLPSECTGLTSSHVDAGDADYPPDDGYSTIRFGDGGSNRGMLDRFCGMPKAYFWFAIILLISYLYAVGLCIRLMVAVSRVAKQMKAMKAERGTGPVPPHHAQCVVPSTAARADPVPPPQPYPSTRASGITVEDSYQADLEAAESTVSDGSWIDGKPTPAVSPPPYEDGDRSKGARFQKN